MAKVLATDDDEDVLQTIKEALQFRGHSVLVAASAPEALALLANEEVDIVLADIAMPGMDGLELCGHITKNRPNVRVIIITGKPNLDVAIASIRAGAYDFLVKPLTADPLFAAIDRADPRRPPGSTGAATEARDAVQSLRELERRHIMETLRKAEGNKTVAARMLGIDRTTLYRKLSEIETTEPDNDAGVE